MAKKTFKNREELINFFVKEKVDFQSFATFNELKKLYEKFFRGELKEKKIEEIGADFTDLKTEIEDLKLEIETLKASKENEQTSILNDKE